MKTILINPPQNTQYPQPPLGLASIAAVLEQNWHQVEILNANALQLSERFQYLTLRHNTERIVEVFSIGRVQMDAELRNIPDHYINQKWEFF